MARIYEVLRDVYIETFDTVSPHSPIDMLRLDMLRQAARLGREYKPDVLINIRRGRTRYTAKRISKLLGKTGYITEYETTFNPLTRNYHLAIP